MELAIFCSSTVLPVRGGATMSMRWPNPMGVTRFTTRMLISSVVVSRNSRFSGWYGVRSSNAIVSLNRSGDS